MREKRRDAGAELDGAMAGARARMTLVMIERLRKEGLHEILFRNAGIGLLFYEGPRDEQDDPAPDWRKYLVVHRYYSTLPEAVYSEYERVVTRPPNTDPADD